MSKPEFAGIPADRGCGPAFASARGMAQILRPLMHCFCHHQFVRRYGRDRLWLECTSCETAGIHVRARATTEPRPESGSLALPSAVFTTTVHHTS